MIRQKKNHYDTPIRAKVQGAYEFFIKNSFAIDAKVIFRTFNVSVRFDYEMIRSSAFTRTNLATETRRRKRKATDDQLKKTDNILQNEDLQLKKKRYT